MHIRSFMHNFMIIILFLILLVWDTSVLGQSLEPIKPRPDMVVLVPNAGVVFVYRDKHGQVIKEDYYSIRVHDQGVGICDDLGQNDTWLFTGGGYLLHKEEKIPTGIKPYWRFKRADKHGNTLPEPSILHNEQSTLPVK